MSNNNCKSILLAVVLVISAAAQAQFHHAVGVSYISARGKTINSAFSGPQTPKYLGYGLHYYTRYDIKSMKNSSISVGLPISTGVSGSVGDDDEADLAVLADVPVTIDYNVGAGSSEDAEAKLGGFIGAGFGFTYSNYINTDYDTNIGSYYTNVKGNSYGPVFHGGVRTTIGGLLFFFRGFYKIGLEKAKFKTFGISAGICL